MMRSARPRLAKMHAHQVHRDPWPDFTAFDTSAYDKAVRRTAAVQWAGRARAEHESVHQFTLLSHVLSDIRVPLHLLGSLARLITDEVRHAELCAEAGHVIYPEGLEDEPHLFIWPEPKLPWKAPPPRDQGRAEVLEWAAAAIMSSCCFGETLSRPMLEAIAVVATDEVAAAVSRQILRDEHLHAAFGWESLSYLLDELDELAPEARGRLRAKVPKHFSAFQRSTACGIDVHELAGTEIEIVCGEPNLGVLTDHQYAMIFFSTCESEIIPALDELGLDGTGAWASR